MGDLLTLDEWRGVELTADAKDRVRSMVKKHVDRRGVDVFVVLLNNKYVFVEDFDLKTAREVASKISEQVDAEQETYDDAIDKMYASLVTFSQSLAEGADIDKAPFPTSVLLPQICFLAQESVFRRKTDVKVFMIATRLSGNGEPEFAYDMTTPDNYVEH